MATKKEGWGWVITLQAWNAKRLVLKPNIYLILQICTDNPNKAKERW